LQECASQLESYFRDVAAFKYLGMSAINPNDFREEIRAEYTVFS